MPVSTENFSREEELSEQLLRALEENQSLRGLVERLGDIVIERDLSGRITFMNGQAADLLRDADQSDASPGERILAVGSRQAGPHDYAFETRVHTRDGVRWISWLQPQRNRSGHFLGTRAIGRDVTDLMQSAEDMAKARDAAEEAAKTKARFLATMSHEIRTPLNGILGMAALLLDDRISPQQRTFVEAIRSSGSALTVLIDDILDYSRIEAGHVDLSPEPTSPGRSLRDITELLAPRAADKQIELAAYVGPDVPETVMMDGGRFRQILLNLAGNAIKFTDTGGVRIDLRISIDTNTHKEQLKLTIADTGPGIEPAFLPRLFDEFEKGSESSTGAAPSPGTGLGLAITKRIVEALDGRIDVKSDPGEGAVFEVTLPCSKLQDDHAPSNKPVALHDSCISGSVLLASNRPIEAGVIADLIRDAGYSPMTLSDVANVASPPKPDAVLLDWTGTDAATAMDSVMADMNPGAKQALLEAVSDVPRIALVPPATRADKMRYADAGFVSYLSSPVRPESLMIRLLSVQGNRLSKPYDEATDMSDHHADRMRPSAKPGLILLAEDDPVSAMLVQAMLERMGHQVVHVPDGQAAVDTALATEHAFDLVLMDCQMPRLDGISAARELRNARYDRPIIALTANAFAEDRAATASAGMIGHLAKPVSPDALHATIERVLQKAG